MPPRFSKPSPFQLIMAGYAALILVGAGLLRLPWAAASGRPQAFLDALFTATSAVTTTGLIVVDTGSFYSLFGELVILMLFQIGGLGYMIVITLAVLGLGGRLSISGRTLLRESLGRPTAVDMVHYARVVLLITLAIELVGTLALGLLWLRNFSPGEAFYQALFHAVSAFCTAGFGLFPDSLSSFRADPGTNLVVDALTLAGALGFFILYDLGVGIRRRRTGRKIRMVSDHTRIVLGTTTCLALAGTLLLWPAAQAGPGFFQGGLDALFQALSASTTTGFNTIPMGSIPPYGLWVLVILMFIGASPGGTGGGIKTVGFALALAFLRSHLAGEKQVLVYRRRVPWETMQRLFALVGVAVFWVVIATGVLLATEPAGLSAVLFEVVSAFGTVGLSLGLTPLLSPVGKVMIILSMFIGRVGPLVLGYAIIRQPPTTAFDFPEAEIIIS